MSGAIILADLILVFHFLIALFNFAGLLLVWVGYFFRWKWIKNPLFRYTHFVLIFFVTLNALLGKYCPLTSLESQLRKTGGQESYSSSFIQYWISRLMYIDMSLSALGFIYLIFLAMVIITFFVVKPDKIKFTKRL